jgi:hypothetical protein
MNPIEIFICCSNKDIAVGEELRRILTECYGFQVFLFKHSIVGSNDFHIKIHAHLKSCDIFIPLLSNNLIGSTFCNQEIGYVVSRPEVIIYPISLDGTKTYDLIDHTHGEPYDPSDNYGLLKAATKFFRIVMCHEDFTGFHTRAIEGIVQALRVSPDWRSTSAIIYMLELTKTKISLSNNQQASIIWASQHNQNVYQPAELFEKLSSFMKEEYTVTLTKPG